MIETDRNIQEQCAEALRANANKIFSAKCHTCGKSCKQSLSWLQKEKFKCPNCGGKLDDKPLHQITLSVLQKMQATFSASLSKTIQTEPPPTRGPVAKAERYQLVLQFRGKSLNGLDVLGALESDLTSALGDSADVDGHDIGSGEVNIFVFTSTPLEAFATAKPVLKKARLLKNVIAAYRDIDGELFTVVWPSGHKKKFTIA